MLSCDLRSWFGSPSPHRQTIISLHRPLFVSNAAGPAGDVHRGPLQLHLQQHLQAAVVAHLAERRLHCGAGHALCGRHAVLVGLGAGQELHPRGCGRPRHGALGDAAAAACRAHGTAVVLLPL